MDVVCKRAFDRIDCRARIKYALFSTDNYVNAVMHNNGDGGMYFESNDSISAGSDIYIKVIDYNPEAHAPEAKNGYRAEVMWCRKIYRDGVSVYGIGVRFMVNVCDKCGEKVAYSDIHKTDNLIFLCDHCFSRHQMMRDGTLKQCVEDYLLGNVL